MPYADYEIVKHVKYLQGKLKEENDKVDLPTEEILLQQYVMDCSVIINFDSYVSVKGSDSVLIANVSPSPAAARLEETTHWRGSR